MGLAAVVSLHEFQELKRGAGLRAQLHDALDQWLDQVEAEMKESKPTLQQVTQAVFNRRQELTAAVTEGLIESRFAAQQEQEFHPCPECGRVLRARETPARRVETMVGTISVQRPYFYCVDCHRGSYPLDEALALSARRKQPDLQQAVVKLTKEVPYETACELLQELTGLPVSTHTAHEVTTELAAGLGVLEVSPSREQVLAQIAAVAADKGWRPILVLAIDGAAVPTRPESARGRRPGRKKVRAKRARWQGQWREAKGFRCYLVTPERIVHLLSWHQIQDDEELCAALRQVKEAGLIPEEQVRLCVLADGARWIWRHVQQLFPNAKEILDYYHCSEHIYRIAQVHYAESPEQALEWVEATMARLFCGEVAAVIWCLQRLQPHDVEAATAIRQGIHYLEQNQERINYQAARKGGYPIGSGGIESANKFICHVRLKRSGAWWYVPNGNQMLALRCAKYNGTFDRVCQRTRQQLKAVDRKK